MIPRWKQLNFLIKHQLYLRMLPVVVVAVLAVGLFSGRLLTSRAVQTYLEQKAGEQVQSLRAIRDWIGLRSLAAEARKEKVQHDRDFTSLPEDASSCRFMSGFLDLDGVCGAAFVTLAPGTRSDSLQTALDGDLASAQNQAIVQAWAARQCRSLRVHEGAALPSPPSWPEGPHIGRLDSFHSLCVFAPFALTRKLPMPAEAWETVPPVEMVPVLPVIVCEDLSRPDPTSPVWYEPQIMLLLDIQHLAAEAFLVQKGSPDLRILLDPHGRLLAASVDTLQAGYDLTSPVQAVFTGVDGTELGDFLDSVTADVAHTYLGRKWNPYVFMVSRWPDLPLLAVSALPLSQINGGMVLYTAIVVLMAVVALLGSILAITTVGEALSNRLQAVAVNMEEVAKGDYSRRMAVGKRDEVGRLVSYFNLMTAALEATHHELQEKTHRLKMALARMKRLDRAKDEFLTLISHEVRTPLTSILGGVELFKVILPRVTDDQREVLEKLNIIEITDIIASSGNRLSAFMNDAILMTSLQSSDTKVELTPVPFGDLCELVLSSLQDAIAERKLTIQNALAADASWYALCDRDLMITALAKLIQNAVQHNRPAGIIAISEVDQVDGLGGVEHLVTEKARHDLDQHSSIAHWREQGRVHWRIVRIFSTGKTIPKEKRETLFRKFELVGRIEHHHKGSGLSLPIVQAVMEVHGGNIYMQGHEDEGNSFYLLLPALELPDARPAPTTSGNQQGQGVGSTSRHEEVHVS